jgi:hypothetical protein
MPEVDTQKRDHILQTTRDIDVLLGRLLSEAMQATHAEGGTMYLRARAGLRVAHIQNGALLKSMQPTDIAALATGHIRAESGGSIAGHGTRNIERTLAQGLTIRPLAQPAADTVAWFATTSTADAPFGTRAGLSPERETALLQLDDAIAFNP